MKLILIKIGKVFTTIKRDGFLVGTRRIWSYASVLKKSMKGVKDGDVLIITGGIGDSAFYRAHNQAEELNIHGVKTGVMLQDNLFLSKYASKFKIFIFHRTLYTSTVAKLIKKIKEQKKEILFETDDLVFDVKYIQNTDLYKTKMGIFEKMQYKTGVGEEILKDEYVKVCATSTTFLAKILEGYGKKVYITKNKFSNHELEVTENILQNIPKIKDEYVRIGYFSGTHSHNKDFAAITEAFMEIMGKYPKVKLYLAGPLDVNNKLQKFKDRIVALPMVTRDKYYENIHKVDINIYPLVSGDEFCESKSEIRFIEAGIMKVPTVAVRNQTFSEAIEDCVDGFLAGNTQEWVEKIGKLVEDEDLRREMGEKAREKVLRDYTNKNSHNEEYYNYLKKKIANVRE
jgi:glycosyltransferase involved in cell wall biosynthesis